MKLTWQYGRRIYGDFLSLRWTHLGSGETVYELSHVDWNGTEKVWKNRSILFLRVPDQSWQGRETGLEHGDI